MQFHAWDLDEQIVCWLPKLPFVTAVMMSEQAVILGSNEAQMAVKIATCDHVSGIDFEQA